MIKIVFCCLLSLCASVAAAAEKQILGFQDFPFGMPHQALSDEIYKRNNYRTDILRDYDTFLSWSDFDLGGKKVHVLFFFDHKNEFYSFSFNSDSHSAEEFETTVSQDGAYLTDVFKRKYGKAAKCFKPTFFSVKEGYTSYLCKWNHPVLDIYTGLDASEFKYYGRASVTDKKREQEYEKYLRTKKNQDVSEGAKQF